MKLISAVFLILMSTPAAAHDVKAWLDLASGDSRRSNWFDSLKQPSNGISCCNLNDCYQTEARQLSDGKWVAVIDDSNGKRWIDIPADKVLKNPQTIDGESYLCSSRIGLPATIYCFVPPRPLY